MQRKKLDDALKNYDSIKEPFPNLDLPPQPEPIKQLRELSKEVADRVRLLKENGSPLKGHDLKDDSLNNLELYRLCEILYKADKTAENEKQSTVKEQQKILKDLKKHVGSLTLETFKIIHEDKREEETKPTVFEMVHLAMHKDDKFAKHFKVFQDCKIPVDSNFLITLYMRANTIHKAIEQLGTHLNAENLDIICKTSRNFIIDDTSPLIEALKNLQEAKLAPAKLTINNALAINMLHKTKLLSAENLDLISTAHTSPLELTSLTIACLIPVLNDKTHIPNFVNGMTLDARIYLSKLIPTLENISLDDQKEICQKISEIPGDFHGEKLYLLHSHLLDLGLFNIEILNLTRDLNRHQLESVIAITRILERNILALNLNVSSFKAMLLLEKKEFSELKLPPDHFNLSPLNIAFALLEPDLLNDQVVETLLADSKRVVLLNIIQYSFPYPKIIASALKHLSDSAFTDAICSFSNNIEGFTREFFDEQVKHAEERVVNTQALTELYRNAGQSSHPMRNANLIQRVSEFLLRDEKALGKIRKEKEKTAKQTGANNTLKENKQPETEKKTAIAAALEAALAAANEQPKAEHTQLEELKSQSMRTASLFTATPSQPSAAMQRPKQVLLNQYEEILKLTKASKPLAELKSCIDELKQDDVSITENLYHKIEAAARRFETICSRECKSALPTIKHFRDVLAKSHITKGPSSASRYQTG